MRPLDHPPMASRVDVAATLRNDKPVAELTLVDVMDDARIVQITPAVALDLMVQLANFVGQVRRD